MTIMKRSLSLLLCLVMVLSMVPVTQAQTTTTPKATVDSGAVTVEGTNSVGNLLSQELQAYQEADEAAGGFNVVGLTVEDSVATAEFRTLEPAILVVALYTEDGLQLLTSGKAEVQPDETEVSIVLEDVPEYFIAKAYLVDTYDFSPLCTAYETVMYTEEMQELLASTADDYDQDKVLTLADTRQTNFLVCEESVIMLEQQEGINTVTGVDDENAVYVIENADASVTSLTQGDIFVLPYGENNLLIVKVATITLDGTTATITGDDTDLDEVFAYAKLEDNGETKDVAVDENGADEGVTYEGLVEDAPATRAIDGGLTESGSLKFSLIDEDLTEGDGLSDPVKFRCNLSVKFAVNMSFYLTTEKQLLTFTTDVEFGANGSITSSTTFVDKKLTQKKLPSLTWEALCIEVGFEPKFVVEFEGTIEFDLTCSFTIGGSYDSNIGTTNLSTTPIVHSSIEMEGTLFLGLDLGPTAKALNGAVVEVSMGAVAGAELKGKTDSGLDLGQADVLHECDRCIKMELYGKAEFSISTQFLKNKKLTFTRSFSPKRLKVLDMYWSINDDMPMIGSCPYKSYRVTIRTCNSEYECVPDIEVFMKKEGATEAVSIGLSNREGIIEKFLTKGSYIFSATIDGNELSEAAKVEAPCRVMLLVNPFGDFMDMVSADSVTKVSLVDKGTCGDNLSWELNAWGVLTIYGTGEMTNWGSHQYVPWSGYTVKHVVIDDGVTSIGDYAFASCSQLTSIHMTDSITKIGYAAFNWCTNLKSITIPKNVTSIGRHAFYQCTGLTKIQFNAINLSDFGKYPDVFYRCGTAESGINLIIGPQVTRIPANMFDTYVDYIMPEDNAPNIVTVEFEEGSVCKYIGQNAFGSQSPSVIDTITDVYITNLAAWCEIEFYSYSSNPLYHGESLYLDNVLVTDLVIPNGVTGIGAYAFYNYDNLASVVIPDHVTSLGRSAFGSCDSLESVTLGKGISEIQYSTFSGCKKLTSFVFPESVNSIGNYAFESCAGLTELVFEGQAPVISENAFYNVTATAYYPVLDTTWAGKMQNYGGTITWVGRGDAKGTCGENLSWVLYDNGILTISGTGAMDDWSYGQQPWYMARQNIKSVVIDDEVTSIGSYAFAYCSKITSVEIGDGVTSIGGDAFYNCTGLKTLKIGKGLTSIQWSSFQGCTGLMDVYIGDLAAWCAIDFTTEYTPLHYAKNLYIENSLVTDLVIPGDITYIGSRAFSGFKGLTSVTFSEGTTNIGWSAFSNCTSLTSVSISASVNSIQTGAFDGCSSLTGFIVDPDSESYSSDSYGCLFDKNKTQIIQAPCKLSGSYEIPGTVTYIGNNAVFKDCTVLTAVTIPNGVTYIAYRAFYNCTALETIVIPDSVQNIGEDAFYKTPWFNNQPDGVVYIGKMAYAYKGTCPATVTIKEGTTSIGSGAFSSCSALESITIPDSVTHIGENAFSWCRKLSSITIPSSVTLISYSAFYYCTGLKIIVFEGNAPDTNGSYLNGVTATAYYPSGNSTWNDYTLQDYGGTIAWISYDPAVGVAATKKPATRAVFGGEYDTEFLDENTVEIATFSGLVPGEEYLMLAMVSLSAKDRLAADNLLYIAQAAAGEDGTLTFKYVPRESVNESYVVVCGASNMNLQDAKITFPTMTESDKSEIIDPVVRYDGRALKEGLDYTISGDIYYAEQGTYTCYIRGIYRYTGLVECTYTVEKAEAPEEPEIEKFDIDVARMILGNSLEFQFGVAMSKFEDITGVYAVVEKGDATKTIPASQWGTVGPYYAIVYDGLAAKEMADDISVTIYDADGQAISNTKTDSVRSYVMRNVDNQTAKCQTMMVDMLNYGAAAQVNFNYNTADLANNQLTDTQKAWGTQTAAATSNNRIEGTNYFGTRLVLEGSIQMQVAFKGMNRTMYAVYSYTDHFGNEQSVTVKGEDFIEVSGLFGVELSQLVYADARQLVTIRIYNAKGVLLSTVQDSIEGYVNRNGETDSLYDALIKFTDSAKAYLH